ncbi:MAG TPA: NAD(P)-dependent oxidoreductase [bacterium]|nr:NAD(P)-dependent oxidoreductase [bacterium]
MRESTALILGVTGRIGRRLAKALSEDGWTVYGAARMSQPAVRKELDEYGVETIQFNVLADDPRELPEVYYLFLEIWDKFKPELYWDINFYGVGRVVERYAQTADIINGSTLSVYGSGPAPFSETTPCRPDSEYGRSRYAAEKLIDYFLYHSGRKGIHVRYAHANSEQHGVIRHMAEDILAGWSLGPDPEAKIQMIGYEDFVRVTIRSLQYLDNLPAVVNCCHPRVWTRRDLAEAIRERLGAGKVIFDRESGGAENSVHGECRKMVDWFGEPEIPVETLIERVVDDLMDEI